MSPLDFSWFVIESERVPVHGAFLCIYSPPPAAKPGYARQLLASLKKRKVSAPFDLRANLSNPLEPRWEQTAIDIDDHVIETRLPHGATRAELMAAAAEAVRQPLDRSRPLWRVHWFDGLADGRFAMLLVLHHAQWDGISFLRLMREFMTTSGSKRVHAPWEGLSTWKNLLAGERKDGKRAPRSGRRPALPRLIGDAWSSARDIARTVARQGLEVARGNRVVPLPLAAAESRLERGKSSPRTYGLASFDVGRVKALAEATGASVNDVLTTAIDAAYRDYLEESGLAPSRPLVALVPIAIKTAAAGNQISGAFVAMGAPDATPAQRLSAVRRNMAAAKADIGAMSAGGAKLWAMLNMALAAVPDVLRLGDRLPMTANMMISNPYGISDRLFLGQSRLEEFAPLIGPSLGIRVMFGVYTYADKAFVSVTSTTGVIPDVTRMADLIDAAFDSLEATARPPRRKSRRVGRK